MVAGKAKMGHIIITGINGNVCSISQPMKRAFTAGEQVYVTTPAFRPFSVPGSQDYLDSINGWKTYVLTVEKLAVSILGAGNFDLEVWNELSGSTNSMLYIGDWYRPDPY